MANYSTLKAAVADVVKANGSQAITGANLQTVLLSIINSIGGGGYIFNGVATPSTNPGTPDQNVFYIGGSGTYANFGTSVIVPPTNIAVFKYNGTWNCEQLTVENGGVFDISAFKAGGGTLATYADLAAALGTNGANVPESVRKGGMSIKFVQSSDNKYVQFRCKTQSFSANPEDWSFEEDVTLVDNPEYIEVKTDADDKLLEARKNDGTKIEFGNLEVKGSFVNKGLQEQFNTKVDKETGKSLINSNFATSQDVVDNPEWMQITTDNNDRILSGRDNSGKKKEFVGLETPEVKTKKLILGETEITEEDYNNESASVKELNEAYLRRGKYGVAASPIIPSMFDDTTLLANTLNSAFENYAILCKCSKYSFYPFNLNDISNGRFYFKINHNFRKQVVVEGMDYTTMAAFINYEFTQPINRFNDAILNLTDGINASINTQMRIGEPSAIVSDDMQTLYIYCSSLYRYKSIDGINYELDHNLTIGGVQVTTSNPEYLMHVNVNYIDGVYYLIGTHGNQQPLVLWTSNDGWNFTKVGTLLEIGDTINSGGETIGNFGNTFLHKDAGTEKWYLYYEITKSVGAVGWEICIATCPDITVERETGKYGVWTQYDSNPAFPAGVDTYTSRTTGKGNPNIVCGLNNRPLKYNGKYYIYIHGNTSWGGVAIMRYYSTDLIHWTYDGIVYNNRDVPTAGETAPGNGDHCIVEFKGRTLLFYTWDINDYPRPEYVKLTIDDRPIHEILSIEC